MQRIEKTFAGRRLVIETGRMAKQAAGSAVVTFGETMVLAAVTVSDNKSPLPFFPLTVEYKEKTYAAGKIPGGFIKREGRPHDHEILACRIIDRSIRPLFPEGFQNEVQVFVYVISADQENDAEVLGLLAVSYALAASKIPWNGPIAGVRVGRVQDKWILNPTYQQLEYSDLEIVVAGSADSIVMVEGGANEVSEADALDALTVGHKGIKELIGYQHELLATGRADKMAWVKTEVPAEVMAAVKKEAEKRIGDAINQKEKHTRIQAVEAIKKEAKEKLVAEKPEWAPFVGNVLGDLEYNALRGQVLSSGRRVDGRKPTEVRDISIDTSVLPRAHGSALFTRGQTQALVACTLGTADDVQRLDSLKDKSETTKSFMLHYNFPPFSTGEVRMLRGTSRREIGHGNLAERALQAVLPPFEEFPYTLRIVSDIMESNGSSSMASVCGGSLALFDAGVPTRAAVAGVAMGLIKEGDKYAILTDILGTEDHLGDMDFKVAGTEQGITSIQMDIKIEGLDLKIMKEALAQAREGRLHILGEMNKALATHREDLSPYAPRIITLSINPEKIGDLIGPKGKTIRGIQEETGAEITVDDSGLVTIAAVGGESMDRARQMVMAITAEPIVGETYEGTVKTVTAFGAFIEIMPGSEGLLHVSEMKHTRVEKPEDVVKKGDRVTVKLIDRDERGRLRLSMKALLPKPEGMEEQPASEGGEGGGDEGGDRGERRDRGPRRSGGGDRGRRGR
ncbi:MAG: polyribonucleotide nucleotidyltransferase [Gemmatimonadaceae bacterium]|nr:polyribonucleotide nucleotidyltransferase [Gemmatimonadota bacterium]MBP9106174.1 polyribonucleotide nucleotidyltransferase [Gemmatimonadaceae bacterium]MBK7835590.1 polyribonucleotide nucleotidyltransferase [Gemmatimonadota bacterium]MBK8061983.1 polyribonucleotide nucleotidyltransferase [Gemmatimonadota bacterium]MBK8645638.1 polyribonucleotide nucleotidyltransferase [Gemmatimonadota bacterium]